MNSVRALYEDQNAAAQMIDQLASVMRYALQSGHHDTVPLAAESRLFGLSRD
jgi:sensor histidine kinase YesM